MLPLTFWLRLSQQALLLIAKRLFHLSRLARFHRDIVLFPLADSKRILLLRCFLGRRISQMHLPFLRIK